MSLLGRRLFTPAAALQQAVMALHELFVGEFAAAVHVRLVGKGIEHTHYNGFPGACARSHGHQYSLTH